MNSPKGLEFYRFWGFIQNGVFRVKAHEVEKDNLGFDFSCFMLQKVYFS